jgi:threonine dehydratase
MLLCFSLFVYKHTCTSSIKGVKKYVAENNTHGETYVCINSGANTSFDRLEHIAERALLGEKREVVILIIDCVVVVVVVVDG